MFDPTSRYSNVETATITVIGSDGAARMIAYKRRRFITSDDLATLLEHTVTQGERLDIITARYLGDPLQFWRICDANNVLRPEDLTDEAGRVILITVPQL